MPIQQRHIDDLKRLYRQHFARELSDADAWAMAHRLVHLYRLIVKGERERARRVRTS